MDREWVMSFFGDFGLPNRKVFDFGCDFIILTAIRKKPVS
jgi:hypothetical protein